MGKPLKDETGKVYGNWAVLRRADLNCGTAAKWLVQCSCGNLSEVVGSTLRSGASTKCRQCNQSGANSITHGKSKSREYEIWCGAIRRTENPKSNAFKNYGGRGIRMSPEWRASFQKFLDDMGEAPKGTTLERLENEGPYSKENCVWANRATQARNTRQNVIITLNGVSKCMKDWAIELGLNYSTLADRVRRFGLTNPEKILFKGKWK
jgi:hypothetical protein